MKRVILAVSLILAGFAARGQAYSADTLLTRYSLYSAYFCPEKLYLHLDRTAFRAGETIWFCGYLQNSSPQGLVKESNYIYVELSEPGGTVAKRVKVRRRGGSFPGHIFLADDLPTGNYCVRAYTLAQLDGAAEYQFHQFVTILGAGDGSASGSAAGSSGGSSGGSGSSHGSGFSGWLRGRKSASSDALDVSFYPEGGRYFEGRPARIGFKAMDAQGRSVDISGSIVDASGQVVCSAQTRHDGMGSVQFVPAAGGAYALELPGGQRFALPQPAQAGLSLQTTRLASRRLIRVDGPDSGHYFLMLRDASALRQVSELDYTGDAQTFVVPSEELAPGINHLLLLDSRGRLVSERLFFEYGSGRPVAAISAVLSSSGGSSGSSYGGSQQAAEWPGLEALGQRAKVALDLSLSAPSGAAPLDGTCSVSVLRSSLSANVQADNICSYMRLSSELRGALNDPRWYFDESVPLKERMVAIDLLMLIQGWSYYDMPSISNPRTPLDTREHAREYMQQIRGKVERTLSSRAPKDFRMMVLFPSMGSSKLISVAEGKRFILDSLEFEEGNGVMIKISRAGNKLDYIPSWDGEEFAPEFRYSPAPGYAGVSAADVHMELGPTDTIKAVVVTARAVDNTLGIKGHVLPREDYKIYGPMRLIDYLKLKAPNFVYTDGQMHNTRTSVLNQLGMHTEENLWVDSPVKLVVDGAVEPWCGFESITVGEIESIAISYDPDPIYNATEGVVSIKLQYGTRVTHLSETEPSLIYFTPLGYQSPQKFYSPRYDQGFTTRDDDFRNTLFWEPQLAVTSGHAAIEFCTDDRLDSPYLVCVEGLTSSGEPFSTSFVLL